jgi:hypothetical protein
MVWISALLALALALVLRVHFEREKRDEDGRVEDVMEGVGIYGVGLRSWSFRGGKGGVSILDGIGFLPERGGRRSSNLVITANSAKFEGPQPNSRDHDLELGTSIIRKYVNCILSINISSPTQVSSDYILCTVFKPH